MKYTKQCRFYSGAEHGYNSAVSMENQSIRDTSVMGVFRYTFNNLLIVLKVISILETISLSTNVYGQDITNPGRSIHFGKEIRAGYDRDGTHIFTTFNGISYNKCMKQCETMAECDYVNYRRSTKMCYIIRDGENTTPQILVKPGSVYGVKTEWPVDPASTDPTRSTQVCGPPDMLDATITGNMYQVGSKVLLQWNQLPKQHIYIRCLEGGPWTITSFSRYPLQGFVDKCSSYSGELWIRPGLACYVLLYKEKINAKDAKNKCQDLSGHLVDIGDQDEQDYINEMLKWYLGKGIDGLADWIYIGLNDTVEEDKFQWSDGKALEYINWYETEPNGETGENCVVIGPTFDYRWADVGCQLPYNALCEIEFL